MISWLDGNNRKKTLTCFLVSFFLLQINIAAKAFNVRKINDAENLSSSNVFSFYQDKKGWMWIGTSRGLDRYDGKQITRYSPIRNENFFTGSRIDKIEQTDDRSLWLGTYQGLHRIELETGDIKSFEMFNRVAFQATDSEGNIYLVQSNHCIYYKLKGQEQFEQVFVADLRTKEIADFFIDNSDTLWVFRKNGNALCFSIQAKGPGPVRFDALNGYKHSTGILYCTNDKNRRLYFVDDTYALYEFDTSTHKAVFVCRLKEYLSDKDLITSLIKFHDDYFIGCKSNGLSWLRKTEGGYTLEEVDVPGGINCLYKDTYQDMIWIGTAGHGVYTCSLDMYSIKSFFLSDFTSNMRQPVSALYVDELHTLWIGSKGGGILRIFNFQADKKAKNHRIDLINTSNSPLLDDAILSFAQSRQGNLWIGSEGGLSYYNLKEGTLHPVGLSYGKKKVEAVSDLYEQDSILWIATVGMGVIKANLAWPNGQPALTVVKQFTVKENDAFANRFQNLYPENDSVLWCMNKGEGVFRLNTITSEWKNIRFEGNTINETHVIRKDYQGNYLIGTNFGLVKQGAEAYKALNESKGFPPHSVYGILLDSYPDYWLSTNRGLILYHADTESNRVYDQHDGLSILEFNEGASFKDEKNETLFFGGVNGFVSIEKNYFDESLHYMPPIYFNMLTIRNNQYPVEKFLSKQGNHTFLELSYDQSFFTLSFAATDHLNGNSYSYYYKLDNGKDWTYNGNSDAVSFADLRPGKHRLYVKYYNKGLAKESYIYKIDIKVLPPWYASGWACGIYLFLAAAAVAGVSRIRIMYSRKKRADQLQKIEQKHKEEIYESKLRFFTNISHEFCTPLTLIYAPCNRLMEQKNLPDSAKKYTSVIKQNAERLNSLIQDLIEFNRIESGYKEPAIAPVDITDVAGKLVESFAGLAESQGILLEKEIAPFLLWNSDKDFIVTILLNLLSNAFKYTENEKIVKIKAGICRDCLEIMVSNTGKGIAEKDIPALFDRYHILQHLEQNDGFWSRNGLGLAISSNMVHLLGGTIEVESSPGEWTHFRVKLPPLRSSGSETRLTSESEKKEDIPLPSYRRVYAPAWQASDKNIDESKPTLLIVDDEAEIQWLMYDIFHTEYNVLTAAGPTEALELLKDVHPDLIVSDVIMQDMDGLSFSRFVKSDEATSHIPFILLSAKRDMEVQTEGLNAGAEIYITKPFHVDYLKSSVRRLLERKESLREYFSSPLSSYTLERGKLSHKEHKKFRQEILKIINKNIRNKELSAHLIAEKMNLGLRSFYRKMKEMDEDLTLAELINNCRLIKAADLLIKTKLTIDEIVFQSGFTNRSTFYRAFSKKHHCTPTEYRKQSSVPTGVQNK